MGRYGEMWRGIPLLGASPCQACPAAQAASQASIWRLQEEVSSELQHSSCALQQASSQN